MIRTKFFKRIRRFIEEEMRKVNFYEHDIKKRYKDVNKSISSFFLTSGPITRKVKYNI